MKKKERKKKGGGGMTKFNKRRERNEKIVKRNGKRKGRKQKMR
jgi:hypothetical protein